MQTSLTTISPTAGRAIGAVPPQATALVVILLVGLWNVFWRLGTPGDFWFEDDPFLYAAVSQVASPLAFFVDPSVHRLGAGPNELAPVLLFSMWIDAWIAPRSAAWAYLHTGIVYLATAVAFHAAVRRLLREPVVALFATVAWMLLPSTTVLVEFLSTRHYLIGMLFSLLAVLAADDASRATPGRRPGALLRLLAFGWLAIISKEFYPPAVLTLTFLMLAWRRDWRGAAIPVALGAGYLAYRLAMTEPSVSYYDIPLLGFAEVLEVLARVPYLTYGGSFGFAALALTVVLLGIRVTRHRSMLPPVLIGLATVAVSLLLLYPVAYAIGTTWKTFGVWYRTPCVLNTLLLVGFAWAVSTLRRDSIRVLAMAVLMLAVVNGSNRTVRQMERTKYEQAAEARFMLANPDRLLVSQVHAHWFLDGVAGLYPELPKASVLSRWNPRDRAGLEEALVSPTPLWVYEDGGIREASPHQRQTLLSAMRQPPGSLH